MKTWISIALTVILGVSTSSRAETDLDREKRALDSLQEQIDDFRHKADEHEFYSISMTTSRFILESVSTMMLAMGDHPTYNKRMPIVLMGLARVCESWLKYRKSDEKWPNSRRKQREIEVLRLLYVNQAIPEFRGEGRHAEIANRLATIINDAHLEWVNLAKGAKKDTLPTQEGPILGPK